eukprot:9355697-Pyramimonas_sp.AAC.1
MTCATGGAAESLGWRDGSHCVVRGNSVLPSTYCRGAHPRRSRTRPCCTPRRRAASRPGSC